MSKRTNRRRDVIDVRTPKPDDPKTPTPEQSRHANYVEQEVVDRLPNGQIELRGRAHRRVARFESVEGLSVDQLRALRHYRRAFDESERSLTKSALDIRPRGAAGSDAAIARLESVAFGAIVLKQLDDQLPTHLLGTLRAVALLDQDFSQVAIDRYGGRDVQRIDTTKRRSRVVKAIKPRSGRHRQLVRDEFMAAASRLAAIVGRATERERERGGAAAALPALSAPSLPPTANIDPAFLDERGMMRPAEEVAAIVLARFNASLHAID